jgi:hypothetical protein
MATDEAKALLDAVLAKLAPPEPEGPPDYFETAFLDKLYDGDETALHVMPDWLEDNGRYAEADKVREESSSGKLRLYFKIILDAEMAGRDLADNSLHHYRNYGFKSRLDAARRMRQWRVLLGLFPEYMNRRRRLTAVDAVNEFTRTRMREDGFYRRIFPVLAIGNDELDRSVPTNLPLDPKYDTAYQQFRRERNLGDTREAMQLFDAYMADGRPLKILDTVIPKP